MSIFFFGGGGLNPFKPPYVRPCTPFTPRCGDTPGYGAITVTTLKLVNRRIADIAPPVIKVRYKLRP